LLVIIFGVLTWYIPVLLFAPLKVILALSITIFAILIFVSYINGFKGTRKLPPSVVEMNCPFA